MHLYLSYKPPDKHCLRLLTADTILSGAMEASGALGSGTRTLFFSGPSKLSPNKKWDPRSGPCYFVNPKFKVALSVTPARCRSSITSSSAHSSSPAVHVSQEKLEHVETSIEKVIYGCRFFAILAVWGSLIGSFLCFIKGCICVVGAFQAYLVTRAKVIQLLVEAIDIYLLGTVMLVFGMGLYELFISNLDKANSVSDERLPYRSNLFGIFTLKERPRWLEIKTVNELKTKIGHVIVMLLLIGLFDKSKKAVIQSPADLLCFSASVLLSSGCLYLLSRLNE